MQSGGQLTRDERSAKIFTAIQKQLRWFGNTGEHDENCPLAAFDAVTIRFDGHFYVMTRGQRRVTVVKRQHTAVNA